MKKFKEAIEQVELHDQARLKAFEELADAQRGAPEIAMVRAQHAFGGGVLNYCIEHVGDLTHRMCEHPDFIPFCGYESVKPKVERCLRMLSSTYINPNTQESGFYAEHMQNLRNNAKAYDLTVEQFEARFLPPLEKYAAEHAKLRVYNSAQYFAREAAIALGKQDFDKARDCLQRLDYMLETPERWVSYASVYDPNHAEFQPRESLTEAPISNVELMGPEDHEGVQHPFDKGTGFSKVDRDILSSPKGLAKVIRAFKNTPHNFEIFFINSDALDGDDDIDNNEVDERARSLQVGVKRSYADIDGVPGVIRVVLLSNLSPMDLTVPKMPMTGWTLAHKIGHALQDECYNSGWQTPWAEPVQRILTLLNNIAAKDTGEPYEGAAAWFHMHNHVRDKLTMKSARSGKLINDFEVFAEVIAQYLVSGKVTMHVGPECAAELAALNAAIHHMFEELEGSVLVEV